MMREENPVIVFADEAVGREVSDTKNASDSKPIVFAD
jgi:hypothetical protein